MNDQRIRVGCDGEAPRTVASESLRADGLRGSIALWLGVLPLPALERIDALVMALVADGDALWQRHAPASVFCDVYRVEHGSVITRCNGRWPVGDEDVETRVRPALADRCEVCQTSRVAARIARLGAPVEQGLAELRDAAVIETVELHTAPAPRCVVCDDPIDPGHATCGDGVCRDAASAPAVTRSPAVDFAFDMTDEHDAAGGEG
jgi:hypothetical protein